ncbi:MAG: CubicO group peptidase (beta-lactamase class C family) [Clostridium sp.]|jgi:CubicO group peptidase (beta-lactamase class C family)
MKKTAVFSIITILSTSLFIGCGTKNADMASVVTNNKDFVVNAEKEKLKDVSSKADALFTDFFGSGIFSGYVYVTKNDSIILDKAYGKADFEKEISNTAQTKFDLASLTKQFTSLSVMQLQEKKLLNVNDKIDKYLPLFPHGNEITIHQLLTHTSGLPEHPDKFDIRKFRPSNKINKVDAKKMEVTLAFTPGSSFSYSNTGYILLGYIIEKTSTKTLDAYFAENIFKPLDMKNTGFQNKNSFIDNLAVGYLSNKKDKAETSWSETNVGVVRGSSGLCSTVEDLIKWDKALTNKKLINKESYDKMYTPYENNYGYGWYVYKDSNDKYSYEHYGVGSGYRSYILRNVQANTTAIILNNFGDSPLEDVTSLLKDYIK